MIFLGLCLSTGALAAPAGREARDKKKELEAKIEKAISAFEKACGYKYKATVKWDSYTTAESMWVVSSPFEDAAEVASKVCSDAEGKAAVKAGFSEMVVEYNEDPGSGSLNKGVLKCDAGKDTRCGGVSSLLSKL